MRAVRHPAALAVLTAIIVVPPVGLWHFRSVYLPDHVPNAAEAIAWLTSADNGQLFLLLLVGVGAVAWLQLVTAIILEVLAWLRGGSAPRLPGFGWAQRIAAALLLVVLTGTAAEAAEPTGDESQPTYVVAPGDSLTKIAAAELGSSSRYREVFDLNRGVRQPDGRSLQDPGILRPGWTLRLPSDADCEEVVVRAGQTLTQIARERLGDAGRYREIFDLNRGRPQPSGHPLDNPDTIRPGDVLRLPIPAKQQVPGGGSAAAAALTSCQTTGPPPAAVPPPAKPPTPPQTHTTAPAERPSQAEKPAATAEDSSSVVAVSVGALLAAGVLTILAVRRRRAQRRRGPGQRVRLPEPGPFEDGLLAAERPATVEVVDRALRTLSRTARDAGVALPALQAVKLGSDGVELRLAEPCEPIDPFVATSSTEWKLAPEARLDLKASSAPYPALVSLGHTARGDLVLVDLRQAGVVILDGARPAAEEVLLALRGIWPSRPGPSRCW